ncbi:MAG TPA: prolyl oligopeptidase family serine peptidase, partial [Methylomirabilota bacterium]
MGCNTVALKSNGATIRGAVSKPDGNGPFPAIVLLHGCGGPQPGNALWAAELNKWGYVTMEVDSFFHRGVKEICTDLKRVTVSERVVDAYAALDYFRTLPFVVKDRIGVMGWSHGAMVVQSALWQRRRLNEPRFKTGVAMYPWCDRTILYAPMLVIVGSADDWTPSSRCSVYGRRRERRAPHLREHLAFVRQPWPDANVPGTSSRVQPSSDNASSEGCEGLPRSYSLVRRAAAYSSGRHTARKLHQRQIRSS